MTSPLVLISANAACLHNHADAGREDHRFWEQTWRFNARVAHSWRAHKEGLRHIAVSEMEDMIVTAGKGVPAGRDGDVLRVWDLATCRAGSCKCKSLSVSDSLHLSWCHTIALFWGRDTPPLPNQQNANRSSAQLNQLGALQGCSVQGMRALWCPCACSPGPRGSSHHATAAAPAVCGRAAPEPGSPALLSLAIWVLRPLTAALPGAGSPVQASSHPIAPCMPFA